MKLIEAVETIAKTLEDGRINYLNAVQEVKESTKFTPEYKAELIKEICERYGVDVKEANIKVKENIEEFLKANTPTGRKSNLLKLNDVIGLIKNLKTKLTDEELSLITQDFNDEFKTMELLRRDLQERGIPDGKYSKTFKKLNLKEEIISVSKALEPFKNGYFSENIQDTCLKYSLSELQFFEAKIEELINL